MPWRLSLNIGGGFLAGDSAGVHGEAHGVSGQQEHIAVIVKIAGIRTRGVQAGNRLKVAVAALADVVDADSTHGAVAGGANPGSKVGCLNQRPQEPVVLEELLIDRIRQYPWQIRCCGTTGVN